MSVHTAVTLLLAAPLLLVVLPVCAYLAVLTLAAPFGSGARVRPSRPSARRFVVLVPAHNEEGVIGRLLESLRALETPRDRYDVRVVADNCDDATAAEARAGGAIVHERHDSTRPGKGHALAWLIEQLHARGHRYDAYVVIDADSKVSPNFLTAMDAALSSGAAVVQAYYTILPVTGRRTEALREAALALVHFVRPSAKRALHLSAGLKGNGMAFDRAVVERFGWPTTGLAEDVEFHLALVYAGIPVAFAPDAVVYGEMPGTLSGSRSQHERWEAGRLATVRARALPLVRDGLRRRNPVMVDAGVEQLIPPLSVPIALALLVLVAGLVARSPVAWVMAGAMLTVFALHVVIGLVIARVPARAYVALAGVPVYMMWKVLLYSRALAGRYDRRWVRTERASGG